MPGDQNKIITNGTSAGSALSSLVGATANHPDYQPYLNSIGALDSTDEIFAASCYCPITNLDRADAAYEWQFLGVNDYHRKMMKMSEGGRPTFAPVDGTMTPLQVQISTDLCDLLKLLKYLDPSNINDNSKVDIRWKKEEAIQCVASNLDLILKMSENYSKNIDLTGLSD